MTTPNRILLPALRPDLRILPGPAAPDGGPAYVLHDPLGGTYDHLSWQGLAILERLARPRDLDDLVRDLARETTAGLTREDILAFCRDLGAKGFTRADLVRPVEDLEREGNARTQGPLRWLLTHYLYFRIPLVRPDAFLARTLPALSFLARGPMLALYSVVFAAGLAMLSLRFEQYAHTFPHYLNGIGALWFALAVTGLKILHEFAHAYTAKAMGLRVPVMGVAFLVLWPVAYSDVTDAWSLPDRRRRLAIALAGIAAELAVAGAALFLWAVSAPGLAQSIFFVLSSGSLASTLLVNLNPAMNFDGYYVLMDLWGIDNLRPRSQALARWVWRKAFLGLDDPCPEPGIARRRLWAMTGYAAFSFAYRLALYLGIALFVYHAFTKVLGVLLFAVEVWWFIARPFVQEARAVFARRARLRPNRRLCATLACAGLLLAWAALPLGRSFRVPAAVVPESSQNIYAPHPGRIERIAARLNARVEAGEVLVEIAVPAQTAQLEHWRLEGKILERQARILAVSGEDAAFMPQKEEELSLVQARIRGLEGQLEQNRQRAAIPGVVAEWDDTLRPGDHVGRNQILGRIVDTDRLRVQAYVSELDVAGLRPGDEAVFHGDAEGARGRAVIREISPLRAENIEHLALTSQGRGSLAVGPDRKGRLVLQESHYLVEAELLPGHERLLPGLSGELALTSPPRSLLRRLAGSLLRGLSREAHPG